MKSLFQSVDAPFLTRDQAKALTDRVLGMAKADETRLGLNTGWSGNTRFAGAEITTSGGITDTSLTVTSTVGKRRASATTNVLDDASLRRTVDLAERLARLVRPRADSRGRTNRSSPSPSDLASPRVGWTTFATA